MAVAANAPITVAGAGAIGCYVGGLLARVGRDVTLLLRPEMADAIGTRGLRVTALDGMNEDVEPAALKLHTEAQGAFGGAGVVLVTVKAGDTDAMAHLIARHAREDAVIVSMQNGVSNADVLRAVVGPRQVVPAMVPYNVVRTLGAGMQPRCHRATSGTIRIGAGVPGLARLLDVPGARVAEHPDMEAVLWGKLVLNMNNALNALSGLTLASELGDRRWRLLLARQMSEALRALRAAGIRPARIEGVSPHLIPLALRLRDPLFRLVARGMLSVDPEARSSMADDLARGRPTEIDQFQGTVIALAADTGIEVPISRRVHALIKEREKEGGLPGLDPDEIAEQPVAAS